MKPTLMLVAGDPTQYTGGYIYDARISRAASRAGHAIEVVGLAGRFPEADDPAASALTAALAARLDGELVIVDGLVFGALPEIIARESDRLRLVALIHHPLADESGIDGALADRLFANERRALANAAHVIVTSEFTARRLASAYGVARADLDIVAPGLDKPAGIALRKRGGTPRLLCVASLIPRKGHAVLVAALAQVADLAWRCDFIGDTERDPACVADIRDAIDRHQLAGRIHLNGSRPPQALSAAYDDATLFILPSYYEGYGMVVTEALAHGLPVITTTGGALADTLPDDAGLAVPPGDSEALADGLRRLLSDPDAYAGLAAGALRAAATLPDWDDAGARFAAILDRVALA
ncbi:glycosyltransferase family 4 protein [Salinisphaera sp. LB1]|uniref:glycosyltransferase family 4 protein n=1 Tax=Salinisphaera sp. LB1 TaxID=2183911 RepID=UPI000D7E7A3E|nr:glycosyltransferase family 4 protein [Salinisphaera sp. LB1]AWN17297.1 Glycosyl transferase, group 1 [Salinisphaera sp. LB1]